MARYELSDVEWALIAPLLPNKPRGVRRVDDRRVLDGIFWRIRAGAPWRDLPERYGPYTTVYNRYNRWRKAGVWGRLLEALARAGLADTQMIDTTSVRVHLHAGSAKKAGASDRFMGRSRGGLTTKLHAVVDAAGMPLKLGLTAGQSHDNSLVPELLADLKRGALVLADKGYDAGWIRKLVRDKGGWANIPVRKASQGKREPIVFSPHLYKDRNAVERFFAKLKQFRAVATRYDKAAANFLATAQLACVRLWLRLSDLPL